MGWRALALAAHERKRRERDQHLAFYDVLHSCLDSFLLSPFACFLLSLSWL